MKRWRVPLKNDTSPLVRGPATRRLELPRRRRAGRALSVLSKMSGDRFAKWATRASAFFGRPAFSVTYDPERNIYITQDFGQHAFSHPKRLWTLFDGHIARGKKMAYLYLLDQIEFSDGDEIIDVGANTGDLCLAFNAMNVSVVMHAFEPSPGDFAALSFNLDACSAVKQFHAHHVALWHEDSEGLTFYLAPGKADSSVFPFPGSVGKVEVPGRRLDSILPPGDKRYKLLKLEAEGAEPEILEGASGILQSIDYISVDVGFERGNDAQSTLPDVANSLLRSGFKLVGYEGGRHVVLFKNENAPTTHN